jgi:hypothetical protein
MRFGIDWRARPIRTEYLMSSVFVLDRQGNSAPWAVPVAREFLDSQRAETARLASIAASAEQKLDAQFKAGQAYDLDDFERFATARGLNVRDKLAIKLHVQRTAQTIQRAMKHLRLG